MEIFAYYKMKCGKWVLISNFWQMTMDVLSAYFDFIQIKNEEKQKISKFF